MEIRETLAINLRRLRHAAGLSQEELAHRADIDRTYISSIERQQYAASIASTAGYTLLNAGIGGNIQSRGHTLCKIYITGTNLLNTAYIDYMSRFKYYPYNEANGKVGVFNMGRNISIKIIIPFDFSKK